MAHLVIVSFRLGGTDGVSIESEKWRRALESLGHDVSTVAGSGDADVILDGVAIGAPMAPSPDALERAIGDADLVVVENLASLPLNLGARDVLYDVLAGRKALFHHHDLPWQRPTLAHLDGPRSGPDWHHVTINDLSRRQLLERGVEAVTIMNSFDCDPPVGHRDVTRRSLDVESTLALFPSRALERKNVGGALDLARAIGAVLWILGPAEDGYGPELERLVAESGVEVRQGLGAGLDVHDAYAASDLVVMASTWEGFGNPVVESVTHRRPLALNPYPVAREIVSYGFEFFDLSDVDAISGFLEHGDEGMLSRNLNVARVHFNIDHLPDRLSDLLRSIGVG